MLWPKVNPSPGAPRRRPRASENRPSACRRVAALRRGRHADARQASEGAQERERRGRARACPPRRPRAANDGARCTRTQRSSAANQSSGCGDQSSGSSSNNKAGNSNRFPVCWIRKSSLLHLLADKSVNNLACFSRRRRRGGGCGAGRPCLNSPEGHRRASISLPLGRELPERRALP